MVCLLSTASQKTQLDELRHSHEFRTYMEGSLECIQSYAKFDLYTIVCKDASGERLHAWLSALQLTETPKPFPA